MIFMKRQKTEQDRIDREAAGWIVRWEDREHVPTAKEQSRWFSWLQRSPRHLQSYMDAADLYERLGRMDPDNKIDVDEWIAGRAAPVVSIVKPHSDSAAVRRRDPIIPRRWQQSAAAALLLGIIAIGFWSFHALAPPSYRTVVGQQSVIRLEDGSIVNLNTRSKAKVRFSTTERRIELEGEAMFTVAKDPARPFFVKTRGATIRAVGTVFNVYQLDGETRVAVVEGIVRVSSGRAAVNDESPLQIENVALSAGEAARVAQGQVSVVAAPDIDAEVAWQRQRLVFEDATLATVASEFNRYNEEQLWIEGQQARTKRLSGTFDALHPQPLLRYLEMDETLTVERSGNGVIVRAR
jgi:transmembrane sensor